jgi:hypothetical protein
MGEGQRSIDLSIAHLLLTEMKWISEILQFPIIIERSGLAPVLETQMFKKLDFLRRRVSVQRTILEQCPQSRLLNGHRASSALDKLEPL